MPDMQGRFVWYELMTTDQDAAEAFYRTVVGWGTQDAGQSGMRYTLLAAGERPVAGLMTLPADACEAGARPGWTGYVGVGDTDAAAAEVESAGGTIHRPPTDIPDIGRFAVVADPQGAAFALFTPSGGDRPAAVPPMTPGHVGWHELYAADWQAAFAFYSSRFGWTKAEAIDIGPMGTYQLFAVGGEAIGGMMNKPTGMPAPFWLFYFNVPRIDAAIARVTGGGGRILMDPHQVPGGVWVVQAMDPQGAAFALVAPSR